ncbi:type VII secretion protein EsaA, partial [Virgibacillus halodenitrificans]|nr:type VII secretion protein EsaA [Virgibacillus halodenitrificans]
MSEGLKSSLTLAAKILVILVLPLLLFRYVDSQPVPAVQEEEDEATRSVAVVNEDTGIIQEEEKLILGQEIPALLNEQKDYKWTVVNRSAAEQGFSNQKYDAIIYVPSTFSENIMTFKEDKPTKAALNYVIQPNLEAKDRQRIHREMATAKNKINEEMSTIYWSYVSKEVDNIRAQFDKILEKEVAFQDAMYSFYTPSSKTLAHEIDQHKNNLENILNQTDQINDVSSDSANAANEAENKMKTFTEALEAYKET